MKLRSAPGMINARRLSALERLRAQLISGDTPDSSKPRIEKEIQRLESRVKPPHTAMAETRKQYRGAR